MHARVCALQVPTLCTHHMNGSHHTMGWLQLVGSLKLQVSFAEYHLFYRALLQKRPVILRSLQVVATPYCTLAHMKESPHHCIHINASHHTIVNSSWCIRELRLLSFFVFVTIKFCWKGNTIVPVFVHFRFPLHLGVVAGASDNYDCEIFCSCTSFCICTSLLKFWVVSISKTLNIWRLSFLDTKHTTHDMTHMNESSEWFVTHSYVMWRVHI